MYPKEVKKLKSKRKLLASLNEGRREIERLIDEERRDFMHADEQRILAYANASEAWLQKWPALDRDLLGLDLLSAHVSLVKEAEKRLPFRVKK